MSIAYLLIGGNLGNRLAYLQKAGTLIEQNCGNIVHSSAIYETAAWGVWDQPSFYNQALAVNTLHTPEDLMRQLLAIELEMGRERTRKMGPRVIDLDILLMDAFTIQTAFLTIPHPALPFRRFALLPLCDIAPDLLHPVLHMSIRQLLADCTDELDVQKKYASAN